MGRRSLILLIVVIGALIYWSYSGVNRDGTGRIVSDGSLDVFDLRVGDCYDDRSIQGTDQTIELSSVKGVPCDQPHDNEVYAQIDLPHADYPGDEVITTMAEDFCYEQFSAFVGQSYENSILDVTYIYPTSESWQAMDDKRVSCAVFDMNLDKLTGTMRGAGI